MKLLVLAGGFGTRLKTAVPDLPKALAPVGEVPFLQIQIEHWIKQGIQDFTFLLHHQSDLIVSYLKKEKNGILKNCDVSWVIEPTPMNTGGAVAYAVREMNLTGNFLLTNADTWLGIGIQEIMLSSPPSIAVVSLKVANRYGQVNFDSERRVIEFTEKSQQNLDGWINAGLYLLDANLFNNWNGLPYSLERNFFKSLIDIKNLKAIPLQTDFIDIGIPTDYYEFCRRFKSEFGGTVCN